MSVLPPAPLPDSSKQQFITKPRCTVYKASHVLSLHPHYPWSRCSYPHPAENCAYDKLSGLHKTTSAQDNDCL